MSLKSSLFSIIFFILICFCAWSYGYKSQLNSVVINNSNQERKIHSSVFNQVEFKKSSSVSINNSLTVQKQVSTEINQPSNENLIDNWDLSELNVNAEIFANFFKETQPKSIVYYTTDGVKYIHPKRYAEGNAQSDKVLYLSNVAFVQNMVHDQKRQNFQLNDEQSADNPDNIDTPKDKSHRPHQKYLLPSFSYDIERFSAGTRHNGTKLVPVAENYRAALNGPDYSFDNFSKNNDAEMIAHLSTVLPLGTNGTLVLNISNDGVILATGGIDFAVYQTTFLIEGTDMLWQKFAHLGVSNTLDEASVKWFPCDPDAGEIRQCVGAVPTDEGGDQFRLADIGESEARYIWIKDTGLNFDIKSKWPTEGCVLDALKVYHAYITK